MTTCGCNSCRERDALTRAEMAEHKADFERWLQKRRDRQYPPLPPDHEKRNVARYLDEAIARADGWPTTTVRRVT